MKIDNRESRNRLSNRGGKQGTSLAWVSCTLAFVLSTGMVWADFSYGTCLYDKPVPSKEGCTLNLGGVCKNRKAYTYTVSGEEVPRPLMRYEFNLTNMPSWCERAVLTVNGTSQTVTTAPQAPIVMAGTHDQTDTLGLTLTIKPNAEGTYRFFETSISASFETGSGWAGWRKIANYGVTQQRNGEAEIVYDYIQNTIMTRDDGSAVTNKRSVIIQKYNGTSETFTVPTEIGGDYVLALDEGAFKGNPHLKSVIVPPSVNVIGNSAFADCTNLVSAIIEGEVFGFSGKTLRIKNVQTSSLLYLITLREVKGVPSSLFAGCTRLQKAVFAPGQSRVGSSAFSGCTSLETLTIPRTLSYIGTGAFAKCSALKVVELSGKPPSNLIKAGFPEGVKMRYNGVWADTWLARYPGFSERFGTDFTTALTAQTGKRDGAGNPLSVWQDLVAGTDPTDETSAFTASISVDAVTGRPVIGWTPELPAAETALRTYRKFGKVHLSDPSWTEFFDNEEDFNFFKVVVDMK